MTGLIVSVKLDVEPAFRLRESKVPVHMDYLLGTSAAEERIARSSIAPGLQDEKTPLLSPNANEQVYEDPNFVAQRNLQSMQKIEDIAKSAEHVRMWWYPQTGGVIVARANRTYEASPFSASTNRHGMRADNLYHAIQPPIKVWSLFGDFFHYHVTQFFLYLCTFVPRYTSWVGKWAWWLNESPVVQQDHSYKVYTFDCLVSATILVDCGQLFNLQRVSPF
jgi:hypothetical protein